MTEAENCGLTEREAKLVGHPAGTALPDLPAAALRLLATDYRDDQFERDHFAHYHGAYMGWSGVMFGIARLNALCRLMGEQEFDATMAEVRANWLRICVAADARERALAPCTRCGRSRRLADERSELCGDCASEQWKREHPSDEAADVRAGGDDDIPF
jgi:hypothetical protein